MITIDLRMEMMYFGTKKTVEASSIGYGSYGWHIHNSKHTYYLKQGLSTEKFKGYGIGDEANLFN